ncbi:MAG: nodulation protein NfeD [Bacteroidetes bacterium]|nr:nodulation protein NfeD [Bacteroidota bacterium]
MRNRSSIARILCGLLLTLASLSMAYAQNGAIYVIEITGEVDPAMPPYVQRVIAEANEHGASAVMLHVNTLGGRVDVAADVKDAVLNSKVPVIAYVDKRAISAGAFITLAAGRIAMSPGSTMGAATPVYGNGEKASEKVVSFMRSEMRSTAERNKRDPRIAEAMVDESVTLSDSLLKGNGQLLTLTAEEARQHGYCDAIAPTIEEAAAALGYRDARIVRTSYIWSESLVRLLTNSVMSSILIMLGLGGLFYSVKTGHVNALTLIGVVSIALFFGAHFMADMATFVEVLMFVTGVALIIMEVFVIPGFGIAGVAGILLVVGSLFLSLIYRFDMLTSDSIAAPLYTLAASFVGLGILIALMVRYVPQSSTFNRLVHSTAQNVAAGYVSAPNYSGLVGFSGRALTTLRPAGLAQLGDGRYDVITNGEYIPAGEDVKVIRVEGRKIIVGKTQT